MAFLTEVRRGAVASSTTNSTTWASPNMNFAATNGLSTAINAGENVRWTLIVSADGNPTLTENGGLGWTKVGQTSDGTAAVTEAVFYIDTTAAFTAVQFPSFSIASTASEQFSAVMYAHKAASGKLIGMLTSTVTSGSSTNSNPPSITNGTGASQDATVIATRSGDSTTLATGVPASYSNLLSIAAGGTNGASTNAAARNITLANAASEDPGTFTSATEQWVSYTLGLYEYTPAAFSLSATSYTFYEDDAGLTSSTALNTEASDITRHGGQGPFQLRVQIDEVGGGTSGLATDDYVLSYTKNATGVFTDITTTSSNVKAVTSANFADNAAVSARLSNPGGTYTTGVASHDGSVDNFQLPASNYTEFVFALQLVPADLVVGDTLDFKVKLNGTTILTSSPPTITVIATPVATGHSFGIII